MQELLDLAEMNFVGGIIIFIIFCVLAANLSGIKKSIRRDRILDAETRYRVSKTLGNTDEAYDALLYLFYCQILKEKIGDRIVVYQELKEKHEADFKEINKPVPVLPFL